MGQFDQTARYAAKIDPPGFFPWLLGGSGSPLTFREWADTRRLSLPGDPDRTNDTVALFDNSEAPDRPFTLIVEMQTDPDPNIPERLGLYALTYRLELTHTAGKMDVGVAVVNLTGGSESPGLNMPIPGVPGCGLAILPLQRNLRDCDAAATLAEIAAATTARCILPWIPLMRGGDEVDNIREWKRLAEMELDERLRSLYATLALVFAECAKRLVQWQKVLEEWNMGESTIITGWMQKGEMKGRIATRQDDLILTLETRFEAPVPSDIKLAIEGTNDLGTLLHWIKTALSAVSFDAFRAAMSLPPPCV